MHTTSQTVSSLDNSKPIISIKEARKILGSVANELTNEELMFFITRLEQIARLGVRDYMVRKNDTISE